MKILLISNRFSALLKKPEPAAYSECFRRLSDWHLGDYSGSEVYITYRTAPAILADTISSLYLSQQNPFILMVPTVKNITPEIQQFMAKNNSVLFSMADELTLQPDGSFKSLECMKSFFTTDATDGHR